MRSLSQFFAIPQSALLTAPFTQGSLFGGEPSECGTTCGGVQIFDLVYDTYVCPVGMQGFPKKARLRGAKTPPSPSVTPPLAGEALREAAKAERHIGRSLRFVSTGVDVNCRVRRFSTHRVGGTSETAVPYGSPYT